MLVQALLPPGNFLVRLGAGRGGGSGERRAHGTFGAGPDTSAFPPGGGRRRRRGGRTFSPLQIASRIPACPRRDDFGGSSGDRLRAVSDAGGRHSDSGLGLTSHEGRRGVAGIPHRLGGRCSKRCSLLRTSREPSSFRAVPLPGSIRHGACRERKGFRTGSIRSRRTCRGRLRTEHRSRGGEGVAACGGRRRADFAGSMGSSTGLRRRFPRRGGLPSEFRCPHARGIASGFGDRGAYLFSLLESPAGTTAFVFRQRGTRHGALGGKPAPVCGKAHFS